MENVNFHDGSMRVVRKVGPTPGGRERWGPIIRRCHSEQFGFYQSLVLVLRADWESACTSINPESNPVSQGAAFESHRTQGTFSPDTNALFDEFEACAAGWATASGYNAESFRLLVLEMVAAGIFRCECNSPEVTRFIERALKERDILLREGSDELPQRFDVTKDRWLMFQGELEERLLSLERIRLRNANVNCRWLEIFGGQYVPLVEQQMRLGMLQRKLLLLEQHPDLSARELDEKFKQHDFENEKYLTAMKLEVAFAGRGQILPSGVPSLDLDHVMLQYRKHSKQILREIYMLIHPDMLESKPNFKKLTTTQKKRLHKLWAEVMAIRADEVGYADNCMGHHYRSIVPLMEKLNTARAILENVGIDTDPQYIIQGDTLTDQIEWLVAAIHSLESALMNVQAEQKTLLEDETTREREVMLQWSPSKQNELIEAHQEQAQAFEKEANLLETELYGRLAA